VYHTWLERLRISSKPNVDFGLDDAYVVPYEVLLSYPNWDVPNKIYVLNNETNEVEYSTSGRQTPLYSPEENSTLAAPNFNAYSGTGNAEVMNT